MQPELDFGDRTQRASRKLLRVLYDAVEAIGLIIAAGACDAGKSELLDALEGRQYRYLRVEWMLAIAEAAPPDHRVRILRAVTEWLGYDIKPMKPLTTEERHARLEERVKARFGDAGLELIEELNRT